MKSPPPSPKLYRANIRIENQPTLILVGYSLYKPLWSVESLELTIYTHCYFFHAAPPKIDSIVHEDNLTGNLKFSPNQPSQNAQYRVESYRLESQLNDTCHWVDSLTRSLSPEETLNRQETVTFPLRLVEDEKTCAYRVALRYHNVEEEVISQVHPERLRRTGKFLSMCCFNLVPSRRGCGI